MARWFPVSSACCSWYSDKAQQPDAGEHSRYLLTYLNRFKTTSYLPIIIIRTYTFRAVRHLGRIIHLLRRLLYPLFTLCLVLRVLAIFQLGTVLEVHVIVTLATVGRTVYGALWHRHNSVRHQWARIVVCWTRPTRPRSLLSEVLIFWYNGIFSV